MVATVSLRAKKMAKQKYAIAQAFAKQLESEGYEDVIIKDLCSQVEISEGTFYNYFPRKLDVVLYIMDCLFIRVAWQVMQLPEEMAVKDKVYRFFEMATKEIQHPNVLVQFISVGVAHKIYQEKVVLSPLEIAFLLDSDTLVEIPYCSIFDFFEALIKESKERGELPKTCRVKDAVAAQVITFLGGLLVKENPQYGNLKDVWKGHLDIVWKGLEGIA